MVMCICEDYLFHRTVDFTVKLIEKCIIKINFQIIVDFKRPSKMKESWVGLYQGLYNMIQIDKDYWERHKNQKDIKEFVHTICHEIGHAIHYNYLADKPQYLERAYGGKRWYHCNLNAKESFAECFADYCFAVFDNNYDEINNSKRLSKMGEILKNINDNGCKVLTINTWGQYTLPMEENEWYCKCVVSSLIDEIDERYIYDDKKLIYPFSSMLRKFHMEKLLSCRIDEIGLHKWDSDACIKAGYENVSDFATPEAISKINVKRIGKKRLEEILERLRHLGLEAI